MSAQQPLLQHGWPQPGWLGDQPVSLKVFLEHKFSFVGHRDTVVRVLGEAIELAALHVRHAAPFDETCGRAHWTRDLP